MAPVAILRFSPADGPGYFAIYLGQRSIPWQLIRIDGGEPVPDDPTQFSGVALMGGPMSVNDDLPWMAQVQRLIRKAVAIDAPVIGHCLGGQLMASALGGRVTRNAVKEIGWGEISATQRAREIGWWHGNERIAVFQWHGDTFSIPPDASHLASSAWCANQAFSIGNSIGLQCHIEMTADLVEAWCDLGNAEIMANQGPAVQSTAEIRAALSAKLERLHVVADRIYARWTAALIL